MQAAVEKREQPEHAPQADQPVLAGEHAQRRDRERDEQKDERPIPGGVRDGLNRVRPQGVKVGMTADLSLAEFPDRKFQGKVVRTADAINMTTRTLLIEIDVDNLTGTLLTGSYAEVHLAVPTQSSTFLLPDFRVLHGYAICHPVLANTRITMIARSVQISNRRAAEAEDDLEPQGELKRRSPIRFPVVHNQVFAVCDITASD